MTEWQQRAATLADRLADGDAPAINDPRWREAFAATPRHVFVPRFYALDEFNSPRELVDGTDPAQRDAWLEAVYSDQLLVTDYRVHETLPDGWEVRVPTSSASLPQVVAVMLDRLSVDDDSHTLEIGTGTGYNAALLCHRLGDKRVTSLDINPVLVDQAAQRLAEAGHQPLLAARDGADGYPDAAPFDRIISTAAVRSIPRAWIEQLAVGGRLVTPIAGTWSGALAVLYKTDEDTLTGHIDAVEINFMPLRPSLDQAVDERHTSLDPITPAGVPHVGLTAVDPAAFADRDFLLWLQLHLPDARATVYMPEASTITVWQEYSLAVVETTAAPESGLRQVRQYGAFRLWDSVETAHQTWVDLGKPPRASLGITADLTGQRVWLDQPDSSYSWPLTN